MNDSEPVVKDGAFAQLPFLRPKHAGYLGFVSMAIFLICWIIGACADPDWVLFEDKICILGVSKIESIRIMYATSCTVSGIGFIIFGYSVGRSCERTLEKYGYYTCIIFGLSLIGIGLINIDIDYIVHMVFVYVMGISAGFVIGLSGIEDARHGIWYMLIYLIVVLLVTLYLTIFYMDLQQPFVTVAMFVWMTLKCHRLVRTDSAAHPSY